MRSRITAALLCGVLGAMAITGASAAETAAKAKPAPEVQIAFANHGGIRNWTVVNHETLLIEGNRGQWYLAKLMSPAFDLPFAEAIGFKTTPGGTFDKFGAVIVKGRSYPLVSLTRTDPPAKKKK